MKPRREVVLFLVNGTIGNILSSGLFMWAMFNTSLGEDFPDGIKIAAPILVFVATTVYLVSNIKNWFPKR